MTTPHLPDFYAGQHLNWSNWSVDLAPAARLAQHVLRDEPTPLRQCEQCHQWDRILVCFATVRPHFDNVVDLNAYRHGRCEQHLLARYCFACAHTTITNLDTGMMDTVSPSHTTEEDIPHSPPPRR